MHIDGRPGRQVSSPLLGGKSLAHEGEGQKHATEQGHDQEHRHEHRHDHEHEHHHGHQHEHGHEPSSVPLHHAILEKNDRIAERNRGFFSAKGLLVLNVVSAPGSGKTTLLQQTAQRLRSRLRMGVIVGDLATANDAERLRKAEVPVVQINTGTVCHLEADMVARASQQLNLAALDVLIIENVGNLVCPAAYDLGEDLRVVLLSATEGEDKPLKYPPMFHSADVALITKSDLAQAAGFDRATALANLHKVSHHATVLELSARTGEGMDAWCDLLVRKHLAKKGNG